MPEVLVDARAKADQAVKAKRAVRRTPTTQRAKKGRPTRLHRGLIEDVCALIRAGNYQETAAVAVGISKATYHGWKARGLEARAIIEATGGLPEDKAGERLFLEFLDAVEEARADAESEAIQTLLRLAHGGEVIEVEVHLDPDTEEKVGETIRFSKPDRQAIAWYLERSFPERYGKRLEIGGPDQGPIPVEVEVSARDSLRKRLSQVAGRLEESSETVDAPAIEA